VETILPYSSLRMLRSLVILFTLKKGIPPIWNHRQWCGTFGLWTESLHQV
jgi:hypothetical protein